MESPKELTRAQILRTASKFKWNRKGMKWTVIVEGRELPARTLVIEAAGASPNDPTNSHQAVEILNRLGFETRYSKEPRETADQCEEIEGDSASSLLELVAEVTKEVPKEAWESLPADLSKNLDHYLYGTRKRAK